MFALGRSPTPLGLRQHRRPDAEIDGVEASRHSLRSPAIACACHPKTDAAANRLRPFHQAAEEIMSPLMIAEEGRAMPEIRGVAHFSIPVSDVDRSTKFYTEIVGCKFLSQRLARQGRRSLLRGRPARRHDRWAACVLSQSRRQFINRTAYGVDSKRAHIAPTAPGSPAR